MTSTSLRRIVKDATGQDVYKCQGCLDCELPDGIDADLPLGSMVQMIIFDDKEVLGSRTLWSDDILNSASHVCQKGLNVKLIMLALREEAAKQGYAQPQNEIS
jgi:heterodisulfide reductase subunit C